MLLLLTSFVDNIEKTILRNTCMMHGIMYTLYTYMHEQWNVYLQAKYTA